jgi:hypothetical protein
MTCRWLPETGERSGRNSKAHLAIWNPLPALAMERSKGFVSWAKGKHIIFYVEPIARSRAI